ncbi:MAG: hypothetical protein QME59_07640 [Candidatus Hydrothermarchaeota archaeon]|nr:hypothetical protein [Candidatus Hydrothermarchaeota archaeon]
MGKWHLKKLADLKYIQSRREGAKKRYYPIEYAPGALTYDHKLILSKIAHHPREGLSLDLLTASTKMDYRVIKERLNELVQNKILSERKADSETWYCYPEPIATIIEIIFQKKITTIESLEYVLGIRKEEIGRQLTKYVQGGLIQTTRKKGKTAIYLTLA